MLLISCNCIEEQHKSLQILKQKYSNKAFTLEVWNVVYFCASVVANQESCTNSYCIFIVECGYDVTVQSCFRTKFCIFIFHFACDFCLYGCIFLTVMIFAL